MTTPNGTSAEDRFRERELELAVTKQRDDRYLKERELTLTEGKLKQDRELKQEELLIQHRQLSVGRWSGPVAVAVVAGLLGIIGSLLSSSQNRELERKKQEGTLVLESIRTGSTGKEREKQAAANLVFLADAGLLTLGEVQLKTLRDRAGDTAPGLPPASSNQGVERIPTAIRSQILKSFENFQQYFERIGAQKIANVAVDLVPPDVPGMIAYFDPAKQTVFVDPQYLGTPNVPLREYAHAVLYADPKKFAAINYERTWVYVGIESGLASYFASSFADNPAIPGALGETDSLANSRNLSELEPGPAAMWDGTLIWGGAFWDLRGALGQSVADQLLYAAWSLVTESDINANDPKRFGQKILEADVNLTQGKFQSEIKALFERRGLILEGRTKGVTAELN